MLTLKLNLTEQIANKLAAKLKKEKLTDVDYVLRLIEHDLDSRLKFGEGFYYHKHLDKLYDKKDKEIIITKKEKGIILALVEHNGSIATVDEINKSVWNREDV